MTSRSLCGLLVVWAGCTCPGQEYVRSAVADPTQYAKELAACSSHDCDPLCERLFALTPDDAIEMCDVAGTDAAGNAHVITKYTDSSVCASSDEGVVAIDGTIDDGSSDGSTDDGSTDDGSTDDGSTDSGGDSGDGGDGGDGGDARISAPHHPAPPPDRGALR